MHRLVKRLEEELLNKEIVSLHVISSMMYIKYNIKIKGSQFATGGKDFAVIQLFFKILKDKNL